jgi:hypothetical protein
MAVRELARADWLTVLALNEASVRELSPLDEARLEYILELAQISLVAEHDGEVAAFAIAIAPGTPYDSANYRWFAERYEPRSDLEIAEHDPPEQDHVAVVQIGLHDSLAVDERAVGAAVIEQARAGWAVHEHRVTARDRLLIEVQVG